MVKYSLIMVDDKNKKHRISFYNPNTGNNESRTELANIDRNTTMFHNADELFEHIKSKNVYVNGYNMFYINYKYKKMRILKTAYDCNETIKKLCQVSDVKIDTSSREFNNYFKRFLYLIEKKSFAEYIFDSKEVDEKLKEYIYERIYFGNYNELYQNKIREKLSNYKVSRDLLFVIDEYNEKLKKVNEENKKILEIQKDEYEPDKEYHSDIDEAEKYGEYVDGSNEKRFNVGVEPIDKVKTKTKQKNYYLNQLSIDEMFKNKF